MDSHLKFIKFILNGYERLIRTIKILSRTIFKAYYITIYTQNRLLL